MALSLKKKYFCIRVAYSNPLTQFQISGDGYSPLLLGNDVWTGEQLQRGLAGLARHSSLPGQLSLAGRERTAIMSAAHQSLSLSEYNLFYAQRPAITGLVMQDYPDWMLMSAFLCCVMFLLCGLPGNIITILGKNKILFCTKLLN